MEQRSPEWFEARLGKVTASRFGDVLAVLKSGGEAANRKNYRAQIVLELLTGASQESYQNASMQWGTDTEPLARLAYSLQTGNHVQEVGFIEHNKLAAGASPDGCIDDLGLVEIKCPNTATHMATLKENKVPVEYMPQIQGQLWITDREWCDFVSYDPRMPEGAQLFIQPVLRDHTYILNLEANVVQFLAEVEEDVNYFSNYGEVKK